MPKNGHIRDGWEKSRPCTGHSSHSCWFTRKRDGSEIRNWVWVQPSSEMIWRPGATASGFWTRIRRAIIGNENTLARFYHRSVSFSHVYRHAHPHANQILEGAVCYHIVKLAAEWMSCCDYTASTLPSFRTDWFIYSLLRYNRTASGLPLKNSNLLINIL